MTGEGPLAARWHRLRTAYRICNLATHHVLGFILKLVLLLYFAFTILFLTLRYVVLPNIDHYKGDIERAASSAVGNQVTISRVYASWNGFRPNLFLGDVVLYDPQGRPALRLPSVSATLSWWTAVTGNLRFRSLELTRPDLSIVRETDGRLYVAGMFIDPNKPSDGKGLDWLLLQRDIVIRDGRVQWTDRLRNAPPLALDNFQLVLRNQWLHHQLSVRATPPAELAQPLDFRADFTHPAFGARMGTVDRDRSRRRWARNLDSPIPAGHGSGVERLGVWRRKGTDRAPGLR